MLFPAFAGFRTARLPGELLAGVLIAAVAAPESLATARLAHLPPAQGLLAFVAATLGFAVLGRSGRMSVGPDSTIAPIFAGALAALAPGAAYGSLCAWLALLVGAILLFAGVLRLSWLASLLSRPVVLGFMGAIALRIGIGQIQALARAEAPIPAAGAAVCVLAAVAGLERLSRRIPAALIALAGVAAAADLLRLPLPRLPAAAPRLTLPGAPPLSEASPLLVLALLVALVAMVQTSATQKSFADGAGGELDADFRGLGLGSLLSGLLGGFPVNASPPRTAVADQAGASSPLAAVVAAALVGVLAAVAPGLLAAAPEAALSGLLLYIATRVFPGRPLLDLVRASPPEAAIAGLALLLVLFLPIGEGMGLAVALALGQALFTTARTRPVRLRRLAGETVWWPAPQAGPAADGVEVVGYSAPLSFLNADSFRDGMLSILGAAPPPRILILDASGIVEIDFTAAQAFREVAAAARAAGCVFAVARLSSLRAEAAFARFGLQDGLGARRLYPSVADAASDLAPGT